MIRGQLPLEETKKERTRIDEKGERGVCRIQKQCAGNQGYETVGSGIVIKYHIDRRWKSDYLIVTARNVFQGDFNVRNYNVDFMKSTSNLKTFHLNDTVVVGGEILHSASGLAVIPLDSHSSVFRHGPFRKKCGILKHYSFEVESFQNSNTQDSAFSNELCCHMVADDSTSNLFGVKPRNLKRNSTSGQCVLRNCNQSTNFPLGAVILRRVGSKWSAAGVLSSYSADGTCRPVWLSQENLSRENLRTDPGGSSMSVSSISPTDAQAKRGKADQSSKDAGGNAVCPIPSVNTGSETEESLSDQAIAAPHTADETEQIKRNKKGVSATDPATSDKKAEQTKSNKKVVSETDKASHTSLECGKTESNKQGVPVPDEAPYPSLEHRETERNKQGESVPDPSTAPNNAGKKVQIETNKRDVMTATDKASHTSFECGKTERNKQGVPVPDEAPHPSLEHRETERNKQGESVPARLPLRIDCSDITIPDPQAGSSEAVATLQGEATAAVGGGSPPSSQEVLNLTAFKYLNTIDPSKPEDMNGFVQYLKEVRKVLIVDTKPGSLIITVECSSLETLDELWNDYCTGYLNEMAQKFLVTKDLLNELGLTEVKLTITILEEEYMDCRKYFLQPSDPSKAPDNAGKTEQIEMNKRDVFAATDKASHTSLECGKTERNKQGVLPVPDEALNPSLEHRETERNKQGESVPDPDTAQHISEETEQAKGNKKEVMMETDKASHTSLECGKTESNKQGVLPVPGGTSVNKGKKERTQVHRAARVSDVPVDVDRKDTTGTTPLMNAALCCNLESVKNLIGKGADPSLENNTGWNSLHFAANGGEPDIIELLLSNGPDIDSRTAEGYTPLMIASFTGEVHAAKYLLEKGADPSLQDNNGLNVLHFASQFDDPGMILQILTQVTDIESRTVDGYTPLMIAALHGTLQGVKCLLEMGADPFSQDNLGRNSSHLALAFNSDPGVEELLHSHMTNNPGTASHNSDETE